MQEKKLKGWNDLAALVDEHKRENWIYRGVTQNDHTLVPKIGRGGARARDFAYSENDERLLLDSFKRQARPMLEQQPESELEWMAVAQHHGLSTRLLDWTESILVAAMFATERGILVRRDPAKGTQIDIPPAIYGIQGLREADREADPFGIDGVMLYRPAHISPRIAPQRALFTIHPRPQEEFEDAALVRWTLEIDGTIEIKLALDAAGVSRAALFPGIDGLADALNWRYKWGTLRG